MEFRRVLFRSDVLHEGVAVRSGLAIGTVTIATGVVVLLLWLPLRERMGIGTVANALVIGLVVNAGIAVLPEPEHMAARIAFLLFVIFLFGPGSGYYIGAGLGPGPPDGFMPALAKRGPPVRPVRTGIELAALALGAPPCGPAPRKAGGWGQ